MARRPIRWGLYKRTGRRGSEAERKIDALIETMEQIRDGRVVIRGTSKAAVLERLALRVDLIRETGRPNAKPYERSR